MSAASFIKRYITGHENRWTTDNTLPPQLQAQNSLQPKKKLHGNMEKMRKINGKMH